MIKDAEIVNVTEELKSLNDFRGNMHENNEIKTQKAGKMIEENKAVIKRQDKLIVDLQQKNEVCQIAIAQTEEDVQKRTREKNQLELRMQELDDKRKNLGEGIRVMEGRLVAYRDHITAQQEAEKLRKEKEREEQKLLEQQAAKESKSGKLKSALSKKRQSTSANRPQSQDAKSIQST